jgi:PleD family two-component response regulator
LRQRVAAHRWADLGSGLEVTLSIGVADAGPEAAALLERADQAMYRAKSGGRNRVVAEGAAPAEVPSPR